jgi:hypothetical protein
MSMLIMNCITNWTRESTSAKEFESIFEAFRDSAEEATSSVSSVGELQTIYVQYQYDCRGMPKAVAGRKIGRYSKKHNHIELYLEVTPEEFDGDQGGASLLHRLLVDGLGQVKERLAGKVTNNVDALVNALL